MYNNYLYFIILIAVIIIEFLIILLIIKGKRKYNYDNIILKFIAKENINTVELNNLKYGDDSIIPYVIRGMQFDRNNEYEKAYRIFLSLLAKTKLKKEQLRIINYLIAMELFKAGHYKEALNYIDNVFSLFYKGNKYMKELQCIIYIYNNKFDNIKFLIDLHTKDYVKNIILNAYMNTENIKILQNADKHNILNIKTFNILLKHYVNNKNNSDIERLLLNTKPLILNEESFLLIIKWIKNIENEDAFIKKIENKNMNEIYKILILIAAHHLLTHNEIEIKLLINQLRKNHLSFDKYQNIIIYCFVEMSMYDYIKLFHKESI